MFPPNLQKNIRELDRQISLLETECENMETEKKDTPAGVKATSRTFLSKPFVTGPSRSTCSYSTNKFNLGKVQGIYGKGGSAVSVPVDKPKPINWVQHSGVHLVEEGGTTFGREVVACRELTTSYPTKRVLHKDVLIPNPGEMIEVTVTHKPNSSADEEEGKTKLASKRSIGSIKEMTESSAESSLADVKLKCLSRRKTHKGNQQDPRMADESRKRTSDKTAAENGMARCTSSDEDGGEKESFAIEPKDKWLNLNEHSVSVDHVSVKRNRPRSVHTRKKNGNELLLHSKGGKPLREQEIQCMLSREKREKEEFLTNLNDSVRTLHLLLSELKKKSCMDTGRENQSEVLNDLQSTLIKISHVKSTNALNESLNWLTSLQKVGNIKVSEGDDSIKKAFCSVKQLCEQLTEEKSSLTEELSLRNRTIIAMRNKEKEYLSLISTLKFNLERAKEQHNEEWDKTKKELTAVRAKLEEETKVTEALKKSYAKMQDMVENYVLKNDKLRTQMRIAKLESHKYTVLLAGKDEQIKKYKEEMAAFQRQICQQLKLIRSKASENQVETAIKAITNQTSLFSHTEIESLQSESNEMSERISQSTAKSSLESLSSQTRRPCCRDEDLGFTSCRSDDSTRGTVEQGTAAAEKDKIPPNLNIKRLPRIRPTFPATWCYGASQKTFPSSSSDDAEIPSERFEVDQLE